MSLSLFFLNITLEKLVEVMRQENEMKSVQMGREGIKTAVSADNMIVFLYQCVEKKISKGNSRAQSQPSPRASTYVNKIPGNKLTM